jgi:hypothetical protein
LLLFYCKIFIKGENYDPLHKYKSSSVRKYKWLNEYKVSELLYTIGLLAVFGFLLSPTTNYYIIISSLVMDKQPTLQFLI